MAVYNTEQNWKVYRMVAINYIHNNFADFCSLVPLNENELGINYKNREVKYLKEHLKALNNFENKAPPAAWGSVMDIIAISRYLKCKVIIYKGIYFTLFL